MSKEDQFQPTGELSVAYNIAKARQAAVEHAQSQGNARVGAPRDLELYWEVESARFHEEEDCYIILLSCYPADAAIEVAAQGQLEYHIDAQGNLLAGTPKRRALLKVNAPTASGAGAQPLATLATPEVQQAPARTLTAEDHLAEAIRRFDARDYADAIEGCTQAIELNPSYADAYTNRAAAHERLGQLQEAQSDYTKAVELDPDSGDAYQNRAVVREKLGQFKEAVEDYTKAIELDPADPVALVSRGNNHYRLTQHRGALTYYAKAIELRPDYGTAYRNRSHVYERLGMKREAETDLARAQELATGGPSARAAPADAMVLSPAPAKAMTAEECLDAGNKHLAARATAEAVASYSKAIEMKPDYALAYYNRASVHRLRGEHRQAIADCVRAFELKTDILSYYNPSAYNNAILEFTNFILLKPDLADAYHNRGMAYLYTRQYRLAVADFTKLLQLRPDHFSAYFNRASSYLQLGQRAEAIEDYTRALQLRPQEVSAYVNRGIGYRYLLKYREAIADFTKALQLKPDNPLVYLNRGAAYSDLRMFKEAVADFTRAIELQPDYALAYHNRGIAYRNLGQSQLAEADARKARDLGHT